MKKLILLALILFATHIAYAQEHGIINNGKSPHASLKSIDMGDCIWTEGFWADKFKVCEESMVPYMGSLLCGETGHALNNFKIAAGLQEGEHKGMHWHDGDFYKWLEASMYVYAQNGDENILKMVDEYIAIIAMAQEVEDRIIEQQGEKWDRELYENHLMGYSMRTDRYRLVVWQDLRTPDAEPLFLELYDHETDPGETLNIASKKPELASELLDLFRDYSIP